jgi:hypothetical protein
MIEAREFRFGGLLVGGTAPVLIVAWAWLLAKLLL